MIYHIGSEEVRPFFKEFGRKDNLFRVSEDGGGGGSYREDFYFLYNCSERLAFCAFFSPLVSCGSLKHPAQSAGYSPNISSLTKLGENRITRFVAPGKHFLTDMSNRVEHQNRNQRAIEKWMFFLILLVLISACMRRRPD